MSKKEPDYPMSPAAVSQKQFWATENSIIDLRDKDSVAQSTKSIIRKIIEDGSIKGRKLA